MFKKVLIVSLVVLALAIPLTGIALADQHNPDQDGARKGHGGKGQAGLITNVDAASSEFSIENRAGEIVIFMVNADTKFLSREGELESFDDLVEGMAVGVKAVGNEEGTFVAKAVMYIDPEMLDALRAGGEVTAVGSSSFTINSRDDVQLTFQVDENTRFKSRDGSLEGIKDLEVGMKVGVLYLEADDGTLLAKAVGSGKGGACGPGGPDGEGRPDRPEGEDRPDRADGEGRSGGRGGEGRRCGPGRSGQDAAEGASRPSDAGSDQS